MGLLLVEKCTYILRVIQKKYFCDSILIYEYDFLPLNLKFSNICKKIK